MCRSLVDIQSAAAEIRRGKKKENRKKETTGQKYNGLPYLHRATQDRKKETTGQKYNGLPYLHRATIMSLSIPFPFLGGC